VSLFNPEGLSYEAEWFNPVTNEYSTAKINQTTLIHKKIRNMQNGEMIDRIVSVNSHKIEVEHNFSNDMILILKQK